MRHVIAALPAVSALALATPALAADPAPPPEIAKTVDAFVGNWTYEMTLKVGAGDPVKFKEKLACKKVSGGRGVVCLDSATVPGMGKMDSTYLIGWDADRRNVHFFAIGSGGEVHDHTLHWTSDTTLVAEPLTQMLNGDNVTENFQLSLNGKKAALHVSTMTKDGEVVIDGTGKC